MKLKASRSLSGTLVAPPAKSHAQRLLLGALLADGESEIYNVGKDDDTLVMLEAIQKLGAKCINAGDHWKIKGGLKKERDLEIDAGESGLAARLLIAISSLRRDKTRILGRSSLLKRPMDPLLASLKSRSVLVQSHRNMLPVQIQGPLIGGYYRVDGRMSSQFVSAMLMALAATGSLAVLDFGGLVSRGYLQMTVDVLAQFGVQVDVNWEAGTARIEGGQKLKATKARVEGDWSAGSTVLIAAALGGEVEIKGLQKNSVHPDRIILNVLEEVGAEVVQSDESVRVRKNELRKFKFDGTHYPDLLPSLAILACFCHGRSRLKGMQRLIYKESNRFETLEFNMKNAGVALKTSQDKFRIDGVCDPAEGIKWESRNDHRMAMAAALFCIGSHKEVDLDDGACVGKSYPAFFTDMQNIGLDVSE
jgi:3-phosphoshikimate 1-carboxyvinyltransferase